MRTGDLVRVEPGSARVADVFELIVSRACGRSVLNVGAAGGIQGYLPDNRPAWLHHRLGEAASDLVGVDIDQDGIEHGAAHGVELLAANCEDMDLRRQFELIVLSDVIEHLNAPGAAVVNLMRHLAPGGQLLVTTPNPTAMGMMLRLALRRSPNVYYDHVSCFLPENVQAMCDRYGLALRELYFFDHIDRRTLGNRMKSYIARAASMVNPRLASSFLAVIENR